MSTAMVAPTDIPVREQRRLQDMGFRSVEGGYRHAACREVVSDPDSHHATCEIGKIKERGYLPCDGDGFLHIACSTRADNMDVHDRECHARR